MYSLNCNYYNDSFTTIEALIQHVLSSGMDPNYEITKNGRPTGELLIDLIAF